MTTDQRNKQTLRKWIANLKAHSIIRFDSDVARAIGYNKATLSQALNDDSGKPVSGAIFKAMQKQFGSFLTADPPKLDKISALEFKISQLEKRIKNLEENLPKDSHKLCQVKKQ